MQLADPAETMETNSLLFGPPQNVVSVVRLATK